MIQLDMLVVESKNPSGKKRISCGMVRQKLEHMRLNCQKSQVYALSSASWTPDRPSRDEDVEAVEANLPAEQVKAFCEKNLRVHSGPTLRNCA